MIISKMGGRKVAGSITVVIVGVAMTMLKDDVPPNLLTLLITTLGLYIGGNVGNKLALGRGLKKAPSPAAPSAPQSDPRVDVLESSITGLTQNVAEQQQAVSQIITHLTAQAQQVKAQEAVRQVQPPPGQPAQSGLFPRPF